MIAKIFSSSHLSKILAAELWGFLALNKRSKTSLLFIGFRWAQVLPLPISKFRVQPRLSCWGGACTPDYCHLRNMSFFFPFCHFLLSKTFAAPLSGNTLLLLSCFPSSSSCKCCLKWERKIFDFNESVCDYFIMVQ